MNLGLLFTIAGKIVMPCWLLLAIAPSWRWTQRLATFVVPLLIAVVYIDLFFFHPHPPGSGFGSLEQVRALFESSYALLAGWIHYLGFDLFVGAWEARDAVRNRISRWLVAPCLILTFMFGPVGLGLYLLLKVSLRRRVGAVVECA